uniref:Uncharacterized protein n=1 Tax=Trichuris muris TaxID=70415 RepID=A0A5S6Q6W3_TRIMR
MSETPEVNVNELLELMMRSDLGQSEIVRQKCKDACQHLASAMETVQKEADRRENWPPRILRVHERVLEMTTGAFALFDMIDELKTTQKQKNHLSVALIMFIQVSVAAFDLIDRSTPQGPFEEYCNKLKGSLTGIELWICKIQAEMDPMEKQEEEKEDQNRSPTAEMEEG